LTVFDRCALDPQSARRLTWIGDAQPVISDAEIRPRYLRYFPASSSYFETHDFSFYRIDLKRARFIGGFGEIYWIERETMLLKNPFRETENQIVQHMNQDHRDSLVRYARLFAGVEAVSVSMTGIDSEGFDLLADGRKVRIDFESPIHTMEEARAELVRLGRA
jgi:putative heme iron utilization protein